MTATPVAVSGPLLVSVTVNVTVSPTFGVASSTVLVSDRSAASELIVAESWSSSPGTALLGVESWSTWSWAVTSAVLVIVPVPLTIASIVRVSLAPLASDAISHSGAAHVVVPLGVTFVTVSPAGSTSVTSMLVAVSGPWFVRVTLYWTVSPTPALGSSTVFVSSRSTVGGTVIAASSWSSSAGALLSGVEFGSAWSTAVTSAVLVIVPVASTVATIVSAVLAPLARLGTVQTGAVHDPVVGVTERTPRPAGIASVTSMFVAVSGPPLVSVTVKVTVSPKAGVLSSTTLVKDRSAACGVTSTEAMSSSAGSGFAGSESLSAWSAAVTCAVLVLVPRLSTVAVIVSVAVPALASDGTVQTPVPSS